jgi:hypothetical protein
MANPPRSVPNLAQSLFKQLRSAQYSPHDILRVVNDLLELVSNDVKQQQQSSNPAAPGERDRTA